LPIRWWWKDLKALSFASTAQEEEVYTDKATKEVEL
jgi:hypothetical protein